MREFFVLRRTEHDYNATFSLNHLQKVVCRTRRLRLNAFSMLNIHVICSLLSRFSPLKHLNLMKELPKHLFVDVECYAPSYVLILLVTPFVNIFATSMITCKYSSLMRKHSHFLISWSLNKIMTLESSRRRGMVGQRSKRLPNPTPSEPMDVSR